MKISFTLPTTVKSGAIATGVLADRKLLPAAAELDKLCDGALTRAMESSRFKGKKSEILEILAPAGLPNSRVLLCGMGDPAELTPRDLENLGGAVLAFLERVGEAEASLLVTKVKGKASNAAERAARYAFGALLRSYRFDKYKTKQKPEQKSSLRKLTIMVDDPKAARKAFAELEKIAAGVFLTRDLVSEPANIIFPKSFVAEAKKLEKLGVKVKALGEAQMKRLGMGALLGVGQGSAQESQLLIMEWQGMPRSKEPPVAFVGKGVTFDTGGISIKPAGGMQDMKWDMGGAGVVLGLMQVLAGRKAKANVIGICGLVENMPSDRAQRPGDIVTSLSGQTIEVLNTDAEGRLVLADALWYVQETYEPRMIVDLATLTGAIIVALGHENAGMFSNDDTLSERLTQAGKETGEAVWRLPLSEEYDKLINTDAADMKNIGNRSAGSITAAQFIQRFIKKDTPWAHLDIAGVTWASKDRPTVPKGGTAFGVRLLDRLVAAHYEG
ncbi:MAG: leucyl aminopeptidase [Kiloniellales bacterium]|nr:leucyl aminopeptidase [Kiloniellales bacterium]